MISSTVRDFATSAAGRRMPMRDTPMRWPMEDARLWEMHAYGRCTPMGDARLWEMHAYERHAYEIAYGRCTPIWDARPWMHAYRRGTPMIGTPMRDTPMRWPMGDARLWDAYPVRYTPYE
jgi:hypothetical protein